MTRIVYKIIGKRYVISSVEKEAGTGYKLIFMPWTASGVTVDNKLYPAKDGVCKISENAIKDGEYTPKIISPNPPVAESFIIKGKGVLKKLPDEAIFRQTFDTVYDLEMRTLKLEERISLIEKKVFGSFSF